MVKLLFGLFTAFAMAAGGCAQIDRINQSFEGRAGSARADAGPATVEEKAVEKPAAPKRPKIAAVPLLSGDLKPDEAAVMDELLLAAFEARGFEAIGKDDIAQLIGHEKQRALLGCDGDSCLAELGGALGVDFLVAGKVASVDTTLILTMKILDTKRAKVVSRTNRTTTGGRALLPRMIAESVEDLAQAVKTPSAG